ncbi:hypothetical protein MKZ38_004478 [Zalerion maritima]|uniref:Uncharacterized protein n=1 Tax=Zalerion maritima TaxID=339359 RepID=A0AAD5RMH7_9PEZI|nr:hypothetical protein MKZ38_004478 [Zalerion maritima]
MSSRIMVVDPCPTAAVGLLSTCLVRRVTELISTKNTHLHFVGTITLGCSDEAADFGDVEGPRLVQHASFLPREANNVEPGLNLEMDTWAEWQHGDEATQTSKLLRLRSFCSVTTVTSGV